MYRILNQLYVRQGKLQTNAFYVQMEGMNAANIYQTFIVWMPTLEWDHDNIYKW